MTREDAIEAAFVDVAPEPDPLYDAPLIVFVYTAWAAASAWVGSNFGLWVLVGATSLLCFGASSHRERIASRSFVVDFGTILLFCATAIAAAVLAVDTLTAAY